MLGYLLFLVPMCIAFVWIARTDGITQALVDLIAFNLLFSFEFAALLPGNLALSLLHVLLFAFVAMELFRIAHSGKIYLSPRVGLVILGASLLVLWMVIAGYLHKLEWWTYAQVSTYSTRVFVLPALLLAVGIHLAKNDRFTRFAKIFLFACTLSGIVSLVQTASGGTLLTSLTGDNYLGVFQPLGEKALTARDEFFSAIDYIQVVKTLRLGSTSIFRAEGTTAAAFFYLCAAAAATFSLLLSRQQAISRWLFIPFLLSLAGFLAAFNRTAIITFALVALGTLILRFPSLFSRPTIQRWKILLPFVCFGALLAIRPITQASAVALDSFFGDKGARDVGSLNGRTMLWSRVLFQIADNPIIGTNEPNTPLDVGWAASDDPNVDLTAHNSFLRYAARGGVLPALLFLSLFGFCMLRSFQLSFSKKVSPQKRIVFFALLVTIICIFLINMTGDWMFDMSGSGGFWALCGYLAAYKLN